MNDKNKILNKEFKQTYYDFLGYLLQVNKYEAHHLLTLTYYLILQERVDDAISTFARIDVKGPANSTAKL